MTCQRHIVRFAHHHLREFCFLSFDICKSVIRLFVTICFELFILEHLGGNQTIQINQENLKSTFTFEMWLTIYVPNVWLPMMNGVLYYLQIPIGSLVLHTQIPIRLTVGKVALEIVYLFCIITRYEIYPSATLK